MTKILFVSFVILALLRSSVALYGSNSAVVKLDSKNFRSMVSNSQDMFMVEFYGNPNSPVKLTISSPMVWTLQTAGPSI